MVINAVFGVSVQFSDIKSSKSTTIRSSVSSPRGNRLSRKVPHPLQACAEGWMKAVQVTAMAAADRPADFGGGRSRLP